jgi:hypothetical protein
MPAIRTIENCKCFLALGRSVDQTKSQATFCFIYPIIPWVRGQAFNLEMLLCPALRSAESTA